MASVEKGRWVKDDNLKNRFFESLAKKVGSGGLLRDMWLWNCTCLANNVGSGSGNKTDPEVCYVTRGTRPAPV
jgi:hypothetical protein